MSTSRLFRSESNKVISGVCGGLGAYLDIDPVLVRIGFIALVIASGIGIPLYIAMMIITPTETALDTEELIHYPTDDLTNLKDDEKHKSRNAMFFAGLLIVSGAYFLFNNFGINIAPFALIGLGLWLVFGRNR